MNILAAPLYVVTGVLGLAGVAKVVSPSATATALRTIGIPRPVLATRALGVFEMFLAQLAIVIGHALLWAGVSAMYIAFTVFVFWALRSGGAIGSCGCFGQEDTPPTPGHAAFNAAAAACAGLAILDPVTVESLTGTVFEKILFAAVVVVGVGLAIVALTALPRNAALVAGTARPAAKTFALTPTEPHT